MVVNFGTVEGRMCSETVGDEQTRRNRTGEESGRTETPASRNCASRVTQMIVLRLYHETEDQDVAAFAV